MGKALRISLYKIIVLFLALSSIYTSKSYGQVPLVDLRSFEISFTSGESSREKGGIRLSMQEAKQMSGLEIDNGQPFRFTSNPENQEGFFYVNSQDEESLGRYYHTSEGNVLSQLPVRNGTLNNISGVSIAFDFVYLPVKTQSEISYQLSYKVNNGQWISPSGGIFTSEILQAEEEGWSSFSMQIMLDQLYLLPNDQLHIRWTASGADKESRFIPIALQKVELFASEAEPRDVYTGSLIISEIMPAFETGSGRLEYVELYNSTENPINLKGLVLQSGDNRVVVQKNIIAEPYKPFVLTGYSRDNNTYRFTDYHYTEDLVEANSGSLTLSFDGKDVARALFESARPGTAVQMNSLENAFDGYSSLSHFEPVMEEWNSVISGTPGRIDSERYLYSKTITKSGWYLLEPPGRLSEGLNRDLSSLELGTIRDKTTSSENGNSVPPYIYYHPAEAAPERIYATGQSKSAVQSKERNSERHSIFQEDPLVSQNVTQKSRIHDIVNPDGDQAYPALLTWSNSSQQFELIWHESDTIVPWNSYLVSGEAEVRKSGQNSNPKRDDAWTGIARAVGLSLVADSDQDSDAIEYDHSLIGFWNPPSQVRDVNFSLPKLWPPMSDKDNEVRDPMLFFKSADGLYSTNSYLNFPYTPDNLVQVSVGLKLPETVNRARFVWDSIETLPEKWELEFVDSELGESINMREETSYSFFERSDILREGMNDPTRSFKPIESSDYSRFYIRISSSGDLGMFEAESETPESIELKQNYPNPFNPTTTIGFYVPRATDVRIGVYNVVGQHVGRLIDERLGAGDHTVTWNAIDMPSGVYIVQLEAMNTIQTRKITLIK